MKSSDYPKDLTGIRFGRLTCIKKVKWSPDLGIYKSRGAIWIVACDCGAVKAVMRPEMIRGKTQSCGCKSKEFCKNVLSKIGPIAGIKTRFVAKHGHKRQNKASLTYSSWNAMMSRCYYKNNIGYGNYGGRGITVCDRWHDFKNFLEDMGPRTDPSLTIDRIDVNGNYCKENCAWSSWEFQNLHKRAKNGYKIEP